MSLLPTAHDNLIPIGMLLEIDPSRLEESEPFVMDKNISPIDAGPVPGSSDDRYQRVTRRRGGANMLRHAEAHR